MDRLSSVDASFLTQETSASHMHVGAVLIFEGPPPSYTDLLEQVRGRLHLVPRFRQKLTFPPFEAGRPLWVDDPSFNLEYHVRHSALPAPGSDEQLRLLTGRLFSQQLDRSKPLWEMSLVQGLVGNRFALVNKTHHALVDGISGVDLASVLFDVEVAPEPNEPDHEWIPNAEPSQAHLIALGVRELAETPIKVIRRLRNAIEHPGPVAKQLADAAEGLSEIVWAFTNPAPEVPLNAEVGPHRRFVWVRSHLDDFKTIKNALGGTVNDVVLAVVSGALRNWLIGRGVRVQGVELRALVPVSIRTAGEHGQLGNRIAAMRGPLPVYVEDPALRLSIVSEAMEGLKASKQALGAEVITRFNDFAPPTLLAQASRLNFSTRLFNLIVTNVPGPQVPLYILGRELQDVFPVAFLPQHHALAIAIMSYNGGLDFGLLADYDAMDDVEEIAAGIEESIAELLAIAVNGAPAVKAPQDGNVEIVDDAAGGLAARVSANLKKRRTAAGAARAKARGEQPK